MTFEFGPFKLDEAGRALRQGAREVPLQPRAFDLLVYLVRNRARVVPKDELLGAIWSGVTVTDNSLQRAVSLIRKVLRDGGIDDAIRSFSSKGYRFCIDGEADQVDDGASRDGMTLSRVMPRWTAAARSAARIWIGGRSRCTVSASRRTPSRYLSARSLPTRRQASAMPPLMLRRRCPCCISSAAKLRSRKAGWRARRIWSMGLMSHWLKAGSFG
jgi:DNA-binding winged helix-turn-helix (wHTH) protein